MDELHNYNALSEVDADEAISGLSTRDIDILTMHLRLWTDRGQDYSGQKNAWSEKLIKRGFIQKHKGYSRITKKGLLAISAYAIDEIKHSFYVWKEQED